MDRSRSRRRLRTEIDCGLTLRTERVARLYQSGSSTGLGDASVIGTRRGSAVFKAGRGRAGTPASVDPILCPGPRPSTRVVEEYFLNVVSDWSVSGGGCTGWTSCRLRPDRGDVGG